MLKTSLIEFIFVNITRISCSFKFLNFFFVFSKWSTSTISKSKSPADKNLLTISFIFIHIQWNCIQNKISPNIGTLLNGVLIPNLLNSPFASWFLINLDFLLPHIAHLYNTITLPLLLAEIFGSMFSVFFYTLNNMIPF